MPYSVDIVRCLSIVLFLDRFPEVGLLLGSGSSRSVIFDGHQVVSRPGLGVCYKENWCEI